jgi:hypothetical protein
MSVSMSLAASSSTAAAFLTANARANTVIGSRAAPAA